MASNIAAMTELTYALHNVDSQLQQLYNQKRGLLQNKVSSLTQNGGQQQNDQQIQALSAQESYLDTIIQLLQANRKSFEDEREQLRKYYVDNVTNIIKNNYQS